MKQPKILLFIPGYNCEKQVLRVLKQLTPRVLPYLSGIIFVNNRSTDHTEDVVLRYASQHSLPLKVLRNDQNYNLGGSHKVAFHYALKHHYDYLIVLHGDDQSNLHDFLPFLKDGTYQQYDCVLGSRFMKGSHLQGYSKIRTLVNHVFNGIYSCCAGYKITDLGSGLNMYKVSILQDDYYHRFPDRLTFNCYMLLASIQRRHRILFAPISWREEDQTSNVKALSQGLTTIKIPIKYRFIKKYLQREFRDQPIKQYTYQVITPSKEDV